MFPDLIKNALLLDGIKYKNNLIEIEVVELKHTIKTANSLSNLVCEIEVFLKELKCTLHNYNSSVSFSFVCL